MSKKLTTSDFIKKAKEIHGDKYDYSVVNYINCNKKIKIICKEHGSFFQIPSHHLQNHGCPSCANKIRSKNITSTIDVFIQKSKKIHGERYDYSNVKYVNNRLNVKIICQKHGEFFQTPSNHLQNHGCPKCKSETSAIRQRKLPDKFISDARKIHGNLYDYSKIIYKNSHTKIDIICKIHRNFKQTPGNHLSGYGCPLCFGNISNKEFNWLNHLQIKPEYRNINIEEWKRKLVDGYDPKTNTVYEFLGDYWHGNPDSRFNPNSFNVKCNKTFQQLHSETFIKLNKLKSFGYIVKYSWESDWDDFIKSNKTIELKIHEIT